jgi:hypothetical protein
MAMGAVTIRLKRPVHSGQCGGWTRVAAGVFAVIIVGCGSSGSATKPNAAHRPGAAGTPRATTSPIPGQDLRTIPTPGPTGTPADPGAVRVIRAWSDALRRGDIAGAARYFALPSLMINGPDANGQAVEIAIRNRAQAEAANVALPCGAQFISADKRGRYINALFRLTDRPGPGGGCADGAGQTARTNFVIDRRRIVEWIRAPEDPGDNTAPPQQGPAPQAGANSSAPTV